MSNGWQSRIIGYDQKPASQFLANAKNWRLHPKHQQDALEGVLDEVGWVQNVIENVRTGNLIDGHLRISLALRKGDDTPIPVTLVDLDEAEEAKVLATLDPIAALATADSATLDELLREVDTERAALQQLLSDLAAAHGLHDAPAPGNGGDDFDTTPDETQTRVQRGDLWACGRHRILCGDSANADDVARLMDGERVPTLIFDPPWDIEVNPMCGYESVLVFTDGRRAGDAIRLYGPPTWLFTWDCVSCWYTPNRPLQRAKYCLWYGAIELYNFDGWHYGDAGEARTVWNTRGTYRFTPDPRGKHLADVFSQPITKLHADSEHAHSKPIDWIALLLANCTRGDLFDPFLGSGTTLIAAERIGRRCYGIEIEPRYCDVILRRWEAETGQTATLIERTEIVGA